MYIKELKITNFRNYEELTVSFENKVNVIIGENAQGKTNLMEAIYVLAMAKSHRTSNDKEIIHWDKDYAKINGWVEKKNNTIPLELTLTKKAKSQSKPYRTISTESIYRQFKCRDVCTGRFKFS